MSDAGTGEPPSQAAPTASVRRRRPRLPVRPDHPLTKREHSFVAEYLVDLNGAQAAIRAGYKPKNAVSQASRLSTKANVQAALEAGYKERQNRTQVTADTTVRELSWLAHADIRTFYDEQGQLIPIHKLPDDLAACIASVEVVRRRVVTVDGARVSAPAGPTVGQSSSESDRTIEVIYRIKLWNKPQALELLGRHQGLFREDAQQPVANVPAFCIVDGSQPSVH